MSLKYGLLGLLNYKPLTGYDLNKLFKHSLQHFWKAQTSQIYKELTSMEKDGLLASHIVVQTGSPNRKVYTPTPAGQAELHRWLADTEKELIPPTRDPFLLKLFFSGEQGREKSLAMLHTFQKHNQEARQAMKNISENLGHDPAPGDERLLYWQMVQNYGQRVLALNVAWAEDCIRILEQRP